MADKEIPEAGFNKHHAPRDDWVASLLERHNMPPDASLEEIEPKAKELWGDLDTRLDAAEMVLGRRIDGSESSDNPLLGGVMMSTDPSEALGGLLMLRTIEQLQAEQTEQ